MIQDGLTGCAGIILGCLIAVFLFVALFFIWGALGWCSG